MLEVLLVYFLCKKCSGIAKQKGYNGGLFGFMVVAFWIILEITGFIIGVILFSDYIFLGYLCALVGAGSGALISWLIVSNLKERIVAQPQPAQWPQAIAPNLSQTAYNGPMWCIKCGTRLILGAKFCDKCGTPVSN